MKARRNHPETIFSFGGQPVELTLPGPRDGAVGPGNPLASSRKRRFGKGGKRVSAGLPPLPIAAPESRGRKEYGDRPSGFRVRTTPGETWRNSADGC